MLAMLQYNALASGILKTFTSGHTAQWYGGADWVFELKVSGHPLYPSGCQFILLCPKSHVLMVKNEFFYTWVIAKIPHCSNFTTKNRVFWHHMVRTCVTLRNRHYSTEMLQYQDNNHTLSNHIWNHLFLSYLKVKIQFLVVNLKQMVGFCPKIEFNRKIFNFFFASV